MPEKSIWSRFMGARTPEIKSVSREQAAVDALSRAISEIKNGRTPDASLVDTDEYITFGLDKRAAREFAKMVVEGADPSWRESLAKSFAFGTDQVRAALVDCLLDKLNGHVGAHIDWLAIACEDRSVFLDDRIQAGALSYLDVLYKGKGGALYPENGSRRRTSDFIANEREFLEEVLEILRFLPQIINKSLLKLIEDGGCNVAREIILRVEGGPAGQLNREVAMKSLGTYGNHESWPRYVVGNIEAFDRDAQNWIINTYLFGELQGDWSTRSNGEGFFKERLSKMRHFDQRALAAMRLLGYVPDKAAADAAWSCGEGIEALLEILDDKSVPDSLKKSPEFISAMHACLMRDVGDPFMPTAIRNSVVHDRPATTREFVRGLAFAREAYKIGPASLWGILEVYPEFIDGRSNDEKTGRAVIAYLRMRAAREEAHVADSMERFANLFGWTSMLRFGNREFLAAHDAYLVVERLERFLEARAGEVEPGDLRTLLDQVARDDVEYDGQVSQVHLRFQLDDASGARIEDVQARVEQIGVPALIERVARLRDDRRFHPYKTWKGLKEFAAIVNFLNKNKALERLADSRAAETTKRFGYALLEHPNVSANVVLKFLTDPAAFLSSSGDYTDAAAQERVSPINLTRVERLGLTAEEVRDAIADGSLDRLQVLPEFERAYLFDAYGVDQHSQATLQRALLSALGRRERAADQALEGESSPIVPAARDQKKLFAAVQEVFRRHGIRSENMRPWILGETAMVPSFWTEGLARDVYGAVYDKRIGIDAPASFEVRARIGKKSDASLIVAGNDTASCMPFGDGKTNVYAWTPACAQMVVERKTADGSWRTMAQSVVMPAIAGDAPAPERYARLLEGATVHEIFAGAEFARPPVLLCDNVEPNANDVREGRMPVVEAAYKAFFKAYLAKYGKKLRMDATRVAIGKEGYLSENRVSFPTVKNVFVPAAPISYTDNNAAESYVIETGLAAEETRPAAGVREATGADIMEMAYLEGKGFHDNEGMVFGLYDRQQRVTAALISREQHDDPALTLISRDANGEPVGYLLAYVGRTTDVPEAFIDDFAVDRSKNLLAARHATKLLDEFLGRYARHYSSRGEPFPSIFAQMREDTSYRLFSGQLAKLSERTGLKVLVEEEGTSALGGETMRVVRVFAGRTDDEVVEAKRRWEARQEREAFVSENHGEEDWEEDDQGEWDDGDEW